MVAIEGVDTRALVRLLRDNGAQKGIVSTEEFDPVRLRDLMADAPDLVGENLGETVSCRDTVQIAASPTCPHRAHFAHGSAPAAARIAWWHMIAASKTAFLRAWCVLAAS